MESFDDHLPPAQTRGKKVIRRLVFGMLVITAALVGAFSGLVVVYSTDLPEISQLEDYRPNSITEVYDDRGKVIGTFALQRRVVAAYDDFPQVLRDAILSTEDKDFDSHWGVNFWRGLGAAYRDFQAGRRAQGASTLTMQLARNLFLTTDRTWHRKMQEILLSIQIERRFTKQQIFTMYANQIFLGHGVYGFEAGAQYYFSKHARDLNLEDAAVLAGIPKGPGIYSPLNNPDKALRRRNLVINNLLEDGKITTSEAARAKASPIRLRLQSDPNFLAPYFVEEVRKYLERKFGSDQVHQGGLRVYTSINSELQAAANRAVLDGLAGYERRHGWKGLLENVIAEGIDLEKYEHPDWDKPLTSGSYARGLVTAVTSKAALVRIGGYTARLTAADIAWTGHRTPDGILARGDLVYVRVLSLSGETNARIALEQDSGVQGALLAIDNSTGDVKAMVGGRDFNVSKFNRAVQAQRQVGSSFKPYVYTAAVDQGALPDDLILDGPGTFQNAGGSYSPRNYDGKFEGAITLRRAFALSRNIPAVRLADQLGVKTVIEYARKLGINSSLPPVLSLALGSADLTLMEQTAAFSTFPNDGVRVMPRMIRKVEDAGGRVLEENYPEFHDAVSARTARTMTSLLREVVLHGTAFAASKLHHPLAGKTGTTNDYTDAWFIGFSPSMTCGVWVGFDEKRTLGVKETGGDTALPIWIEFMKVAIRGRENERFTAPPPVTRAVALKEKPGAAAWPLANLPSR